MLALCLNTLCVNASDVEVFLSKGKALTIKTLPSPKAYSLNYHYLNRQQWDYQSPDRFMCLRMTQVDLENKFFWDNDILHLAGGRILDRVQYQNEHESYFFEQNGSTLGKTATNEGMGNFDRFISHHVMNIDFLAIKPLLAETDVSGSITMSNEPDAGTATLTHTFDDGKVIDYVFTEQPFLLKTINKKFRKAVFHYSNYQTTNGITYARHVVKYYGDNVDLKRPSF